MNAAIESRILSLMATNGSSFTASLAGAYRFGDEKDRDAIRKAWPDLWKGYELMANEQLDAQKPGRCFA